MSNDSDYERPQRGEIAKLKPSLQPSAVSRAIAKSNITTSSEALPREVMHNLQYQHNWTDLRLHVVQPLTTTPIQDITSVTDLKLPQDQNMTYVISGLPPRHTYIHPDLLNHLVKHGMEESALPVQQEWVVPLITGERWSLRKFSQLFDHLPLRHKIKAAAGYQHQDAKRVLCGMKANDGSGGDGTIVYYIMQEGEVKPRQN